MAVDEIEQKIQVAQEEITGLKTQNREFRVKIVEAKKTILLSRKTQKKNRAAIGRLKTVIVPKLKAQLKKEKARTRAAA